MERRYCLKRKLISFRNRLYAFFLFSYQWNAFTALSQLKLFVYSYFPYNNANLPCTGPITWLYYVFLPLYYVL